MLDYLNSTPNYWFAGWEPERLEYIAAKSKDLHALSVNREFWTDKQYEAEEGINSVLDVMENELLESERELARKKWELLDMKLTVEQLIHDMDAVRQSVR